MENLPQIPLQEYPQRLDRLRTLMDAEGLQAVLLGTGTNLKYFSGYPSPSRSGSRPFFLLLPLDGDPVLIVHCGRKAEALNDSRGSKTSGNMPNFRAHQLGLFAMPWRSAAAQAESLEWNLVTSSSSTSRIWNFYVSKRACLVR